MDHHHRVTYCWFRMNKLPSYPVPVNLGDPGLPLVDVDVDDGALDEQLKAMPHLGALLFALGHAQLQS